MQIDSPYLVRPGKKFHLKHVKTHDDGGLEKDAGIAAADAQIAKLHELQERLYAESTRSLLIVLQGMDTGGKDGTIKFVFSNVNPQGCVVTSFKAPSSTELAHDFLWRVHANCPQRGVIGIFNRSHYEDVLVPVVKKYITAEKLKSRYENINAFERQLVDEGTTVLKFMLHISKDEQKERLLARQEVPEKNWKFNPADLESRKDFEKYAAAYEDLLVHTSTDHAPWYVVPADRKWYRNYVIADVVVRALEKLDPRYPKPLYDPKKYVVK